MILCDMPDCIKLAKLCWGIHPPARFRRLSLKVEDYVRDRGFSLPSPPRRGAGGEVNTGLVELTLINGQSNSIQ
jgi:hypothetical protein